MKFGRFIAPVSDFLRWQVCVRVWQWLRRGAALSSCGQNVPCLGRRRQLFPPWTEDLSAAELSALVCVFQMRNLNWNNWKGTCEQWDVADGFIVVEHHVEVRDGFIPSQYWASYWECHICPHVAPKGRCGSGSDGEWLWQVGSQNPLSAMCHKGMPGMQTVLRHQEKSFRLQLHQEIFRNCSSGLVHVQAFCAVLWNREFWRMPVS